MKYPGLLNDDISRVGTNEAQMYKDSRQTRSQTGQAAARQFAEGAQAQLQQPVLLPTFTNFTLGDFRNVSQLDNYARDMNTILAQRRMDYLSLTESNQNQTQEGSSDQPTISQSIVDPNGNPGAGLAPPPSGTIPHSLEAYQIAYQTQINELSQVLDRASGIIHPGTTATSQELSMVQERPGDAANASIPFQGGNRHLDDLQARIFSNTLPADSPNHISNPVGASSPKIPSVTLMNQSASQVLPNPYNAPPQSSNPGHPAPSGSNPYQPRVEGAPDMYNFFEVDERFRSHIPEHPDTRPRDSTSLGGIHSLPNLQSSVNLQPPVSHPVLPQNFNLPPPPLPTQLQPPIPPQVPMTAPLTNLQQPVNPLGLPVTPLANPQQPQSQPQGFQFQNPNTAYGFQPQNFQNPQFNQVQNFQSQYSALRQNFAPNQNGSNQVQRHPQAPQSYYTPGQGVSNQNQPLYQQQLAQPTNFPPLSNSNMLMNMNMPDIKLDHFSGLTEDYPDFKALFQTITALYPENVKAHVLKSHLDEDSKRRVAHVFLSDPNALTSMWAVLDRKHQQEYQSPHFHTSKLMSILASKPCTNLKDLQALYDKVLFHYSRVCSAGPEYVGQAEAVKNGIASLLFGSSRKRVNQLLLPKSKHKFNMKRVLDIIEEHIQELEIDNLSESTRKTMHQDTRYFKDTRSPPDHPPSSSHSTRFPSRERLGPYQTNSRNRSQSPSNRDSYSNSRSPYIPNRNAYTDGRPSRSPGRTSNSQVNQVVGEPSVNFNTSQPSAPPKISGAKGERHRSTSFNSRSNSQAQIPVRGSRTASRSPRPRRRESYKCTLCAVDDHESLGCKRHEAEGAMKLARDLHLCYKCLVPDHLSSNCPYPNYCTSTDCKSIPHNTIFCHSLKK